MNEKDHTGSYDQRYIPRDDHQAARRWFMKTVKDERQYRYTERLENIRRLQRMIDEALDDTKRTNRNR